MANDTNSTADKDGKKLMWLIPCVFGLVFLLWGGSWILLYTGFWGMEHRGQFGDMFGAVNSLFSGLAFAGVLIAIYMQNLDLKKQSEALAIQQEELKLGVCPTENFRYHIWTNRVGLAQDTVAKRVVFRSVGQTPSSESSGEIRAGAS